MSFATNKNAKRQMFSLRPYFSKEKVPTSLSLFDLDASIIVGLQTFNDFLFVRQPSKAFTKLYCKNAFATNARCILVNVEPTQVKKNKDWTEFSICQYVKHKQKSRLTTFSRMYDLHVCNILMKRYFLTSVYLISVYFFKSVSQNVAKMCLWPRWTAWSLDVC